VLLAWLLSACLASAEVTAPVQETKGAPSEPAPSTAQLWSQLYQTVDAFKSKNTGFGPVAIYAIHSKAKLPSRIFITRAPGFKSIVVGLLNGVLGDDWRKPGGYWVLDKEQAVRNISKALKLTEPADIAKIRSKIQSELGPSLFLVYQVDSDAVDEEEEGEGETAKSPPLESADLSSATAPIAPSP
jgi:hypothetical protein